MKCAHQSDWRSVWSAVVRYRFGSRLRFYRLPGQRTQWASFQSSPQRRSGLQKRYRTTALQTLRRSGFREIVAFVTTIIAITLCLVVPNPAAARQQNGTALTSVQIEE